jgi:hypothetical protein
VGIIFGVCHCYSKNNKEVKVPVSVYEEETPSVNKEQLENELDTLIDK